MVNVKAPAIYINEPNILASGGERITLIGRKLLIIGGKTALTAAAPLLASLDEVKAEYEIHTFAGYPTLEQIARYVSVASGKGYEAVVGIGGGKALDVVKAVAERLELPSITVPTVAGTCAAWSALTVLYDNEGRSAGYLPLNQSPQLVLADTRVLAAAPKRYLASGIADTYVKWNETAVNMKNLHSDLDIRLSVHTSLLAVEVLDRYAQEAYEAAYEDEVTWAFHETSHAIIWLAGQVGSVTGGQPRIALAHALHDCLTQFPETKDTLHGEKIAFSLIVHSILQGLPHEEILQLAGKLHKLHLPVTLEQLGFWGNAEQHAEAIAKVFPLEKVQAIKLPFIVDWEKIALAIVQADLTGKRVIGLASPVS